MTQNQDEESGETIPLILRPLTPDEWERNQAIVDRLLEYVLGEPQENKFEPEQVNRHIFCK